MGGGVGHAQAVVGPENALGTGGLTVKSRDGSEFSNGPCNRERNIPNFIEKQASAGVVQVFLKPGIRGGSR